MKAFTLPRLDFANGNNGWIKGIRALDARHPESIRLAIEKFKSQIIDQILQDTSSSTSFKESKTPQIYPAKASLTNFQKLTENVLKILENHFGQTKPELLNPMMSLAQEKSFWMDGLVDALKLFKNSETRSQTKEEVVRLFHQMAQMVKAQASPQDANQAGASQKAQQMIRLVHYLMHQTQSQQKPQFNSTQLVSFLSEQLKSHPSLFENQLFSLSMMADLDVDLTSFQRLTHQVEPLRLALLVIAAKKGGGGSFKLADQLGYELNQSLAKGESALRVVQKWEAQLTPTQLKMPPVQMAKGFVGQGVSFLNPAKAEGLYLAGIHPETGALSDDAWQVNLGGMSNSDLSVKGSMLMPMALGLGLHQAKVKLKNKKGDESLIEHLFYLSEEDDEEYSSQEGASDTEDQPSYDQVKLKPSLRSPLSGQVEINLQTPFILMGPYDDQKTVESPLQVRFHFLADVVNPDTLYSKDKFLNFSVSPITARLREAVFNMSKQGMDGYGDYLKSLDDFFKHLKTMMPTTKSLEAAQKYLRDEVLLYLMGKKKLTSYTNESKMVELSDHGDVMASICATAASGLAGADCVSDAVIQFADASKLAKTKPVFLAKLQGFLQNLKNQVLGRDKTNADNGSDGFEEARLLVDKITVSV